MVGILVVTHGDLAEALLRAAALEHNPAPGIASVSIDVDADCRAAWKVLQAGVDQVDDGDGVLVLVDVFGGPVSNLAMALLADRAVEVVTGVNLPMVLRALQRRMELPLDLLARDVLDFARRNLTAASEWLVGHERPLPASTSPKATDKLPEG